MSEVLKLILSGDKLTTGQIGKVLNLSRDEVEAEFEKLKEEGVLLGWRPVFNPDAKADSSVRAAIELKIRPERDGGFDRLAERISKFEQVESCYLVSGAYDLLVRSKESGAGIQSIFYQKGYSIHKCSLSTYQ